LGLLSAVSESLGREPGVLRPGSALTGYLLGFGLGRGLACLDHEPLAPLSLDPGGLNRLGFADSVKGSAPFPSGAFADRVICRLTAPFDALDLGVDLSKRLP